MVQKISLNSLGSSSDSVEYKQATLGIQEARILRVIDLGVCKCHPKYTNPDRTKFNFVFELADDKVEFKGEEVPMIMFKAVNLIGGERATLTKLAKAAEIDTAADLDLSDFLGVAVSLEIAARPNGKSFIKSISGLSPRVAASVPPVVADSYIFDYDCPDENILFNKLSPFVHDRLKEAVNYKGSKVEALFLEKGKEEGSL